MTRRKYTNLMIVTSIRQLISSRVSRPTPELVAETERPRNSAEFSLTAITRSL